MKSLLFASVLSALMLIATTVYSGSPSKTNEKILASGEELAMDIQSDQYPYIVIEYENKSNILAVVWFTQLKEGKELPENKIGPLFVRTKKLEKLGDQKRIVLTSENTDRIVVHAEKGTTLVRVYQNNTR